MNFVGMSTRERMVKHLHVTEVACAPFRFHVKTGGLSIEGFHHQETKVLANNCLTANYTGVKGTTKTAEGREREAYCKKPTVVIARNNK